MQSEKADFTASAATWQTRRNMTSCLILAHWPHYVNTWRHPRNRKYITYCIVDSGGPVTCTEHLVGFGRVVI